MRICVADLEADGLLAEATQVWCGVFKDISTGKKWKFLPNEIGEMLSFMDTVDVLIMHNGIGYDWPLLKKLYNYEYKGKKVDTLIMSRLHNPKRPLPFNIPKNTGKRIGPHSVEAWGYRVGRGKPDHEDWSKFSKEMLHRCEEDVEIQHLTFLELQKEAAPYSWRSAHLLSFKLFETLQKQEQYGWLVDRPYMEKSIKLLTHWMDRIDKSLKTRLPIIREIQETKTKGEYNFVRKPFKANGEYNANVSKWLDSVGLDANARPIVGPYSRVAFRNVNLDSDKETKAFLLNLGWIPKEWNYSDKTGEKTSPKLSKDDPFEGIEGGLGRLVAKRVQIKHRKSSIEGLIKLIRPDGRIASVVNSLATTGRATHRGIVNIPAAKSFFGKQMRKIFISKEGFVLVGTDSDACQIRMLAGRMNDPHYTDVILNGKKELGTDMHTINQRAAKLPTRDSAKTFFYGFLFGAGDAKVGKIVDGTSADGARLKKQFLAGLPALGKLMEDLTKEFRSNAKKRLNKWNKFEYYNGWVKGLDGRPIFISSEHQILVYVLQSDEAIMMAAAYNLFHKWMDDRGYTFGKEYGTVCWYHDEWTVECKEEIAEEVASLAEKAITKAGEFYKIPCPHKGDAAIGKDWYEIH